MPDALKPQYLPKDEAREDIHRFRRTLWSRLRFYAAFMWRFVVLQRPEPLIEPLFLHQQCCMRHYQAPLNPTTAKLQARSRSERITSTKPRSHSSLSISSGRHACRCLRLFCGSQYVMSGCGR